MRGCQANYPNRLSVITNIIAIILENYNRYQYRYQLQKDDKDIRFSFGIENNLQIVQYISVVKSTNLLLKRLVLFIQQGKFNTKV
jgi:hypothetical protein